MFIKTVYLSTYNQATPITGHMDVQDTVSAMTVKFNEAEAHAIQCICAKAFARVQSEFANNLLTASIEVPALPAPEPEVEEADYEQIF